MMQPDSPLPPELDRLIAEIFLRVRQGRYAEAANRLAAAKALAPDHPAVLEIEGDLAFAQGRFSQAEKCYKLALAGDPQNGKLEEKYATALLKVRFPSYIAQQIPDDSPWANRVPRNPTLSALQSAFLPGLGQFYNGDYLKGCVIFGITLIVDFSVLRLIGNALYAQRDIPVLTTIAATLFHGPSLVLLLLLLAIWVYAVIDAGQVAKHTK